MIALLPLLLLASSSRSSALRRSADPLPREAAHQLCLNKTLTVLQYRTGTMKGDNKLRAVLTLVEEVSAKGLAGDVVEAGVAWGGGVVPLLFYLACTGDLANRTFYLFDTWEGLPASKDEHDAGFKQGDYLATWDLFMETKDWYAMMWRWQIASDQSLKQTAFPSWDAAWSHVRTVKGLFADTMPGALSGKQLALLMCDGDMYSSTFDCMSSAADLVVRGGAIYNDDYYTFKGCYEAVRDFRKTKDHRPMKGTLFLQDGDYKEFPEDSDAAQCTPPPSNDHDGIPGLCFGLPVNGGILRVE